MRNVNPTSARVLFVTNPSLSAGNEDGHAAEAEGAGVETCECMDAHPQFIALLSFVVVHSSVRPTQTSTFLVEFL